MNPVDFLGVQDLFVCTTKILVLFFQCVRNSFFFFVFFWYYIEGRGEQ